MTDFNGSISDLVAGDDVDVRRTVTEIPAGQALAKAWLTFNSAPGGPDPGLLQKVITTALTADGQITDDGATDTAGELVFQLSAANTLALPIGCDTPYDIKVKTNTGKIFTLEQGKYSSKRRITQAIV